MWDENSTKPKSCPELPLPSPPSPSISSNLALLSPNRTKSTKTLSIHTRPTIIFFRNDSSGSSSTVSTPFISSPTFDHKKLENDITSNEDECSSNTVITYEFNWRSDESTNLSFNSEKSSRSLDPSEGSNWYEKNMKIDNKVTSYPTVFSSFSSDFYTPSSPEVTTYTQENKLSILCKQTKPIISAPSPSLESSNCLFFRDSLKSRTEYGRNIASPNTLQNAYAQTKYMNLDLNVNGPRNDERTFIGDMTRTLIRRYYIFIGILFVIYVYHFIYMASALDLSINLSEDIEANKGAILQLRAWSYRNKMVKEASEESTFPYESKGNGIEIVHIDIEESVDIPVTATAIGVSDTEKEWEKGSRELRHEHRKPRIVFAYYPHDVDSLQRNKFHDKQLDGMEENISFLNLNQRYWSKRRFVNPIQANHDYLNETRTNQKMKRRLLREIAPINAIKKKLQYDEEERKINAIPSFEPFGVKKGRKIYETAESERYRVNPLTSLDIHARPPKDWQHIPMIGSYEHNDDQVWTQTQKMTQNELGNRFLRFDNKGTLRNEVGQNVSEEEKKNDEHFVSSFGEPLMNIEVQIGEDLSIGKKKSDSEDNSCVSMTSWHKKHYPACNLMHEMDMDNFKLRIGRGEYRDIWKYSVGPHNHFVKHHKDEESTNYVAVKTLRLVGEDRFTPHRYEMHRIDAIATEKVMGNSRHVARIYGFCGQSTVNEIGKYSLTEYVLTKELTTFQKLKLARDAAIGLTAVHSVDKSHPLQVDGNVSLVHRDIRSSNFLLSSDTKRLLLHDFNNARLPALNKRTGKACGFLKSECNEHRSPEECLDRPLTEKIDIWSLGNVIYFILTSYQPYSYPSKMKPQTFRTLIRKGFPPAIPNKYIESKDRAVMAMVDAVRNCHLYKPNERPSAAEIALILDNALAEIAANDAIETDPDLDEKNVVPSLL